MIAFGAAGAPLHAARLCEKLGIDRLIVPPGAGVGSAIGFLRAPFSYEATRGLYQRLDAFDARCRLNAAIGEIARRGGSLRRLGGGRRGGPPPTSPPTCAMRGRGGRFPCILDRTAFRDGDAEHLLAAFEAALRRALRPGVIAGLPVGGHQNWSLRVSTASPRVTPVAPQEAGAAPPVVARAAPCSTPARGGGGDGPRSPPVRPQGRHGVRRAGDRHRERDLDHPSTEAFRLVAERTVASDTSAESRVMNPTVHRLPDHVNRLHRVVEEQAGRR